MHAFDRGTDRQRNFSSQDRVCIPCSAVKSCAFLRHSVGVALYAAMLQRTSPHKSPPRIDAVARSWEIIHSLVGLANTLHCTMPLCETARAHWVRTNEELWLAFIDMYSATVWQNQLMTSLWRWSVPATVRLLFFNFWTKWSKVF